MIFDPFHHQHPSHDGCHTTCFAEKENPDNFRSNGGSILDDMPVLSRDAVEDYQNLNHDYMVERKFGG
jgi:hypothetical protein